MQTKDQILKNWKVMATASTVAALGITGIAIASTGNDERSTPPAIEIADQRGIDVSLITSTTQPTFEIVPGPTFGPLGGDSIESMDSLDSVGSDDSMDDPVADNADDSPDDSPDDSMDSDDDPIANNVDDSPDDSMNSDDSLDSD